MQFEQLAKLAAVIWKLNSPILYEKYNHIIAFTSVHVGLFNRHSAARYIKGLAAKRHEEQLLL
jgi:hypothetical protein